MKYFKYIHIILFILMYFTGLEGQTLNEGFEGPFPPVGWLVYQNDCGTEVYWWQDSDQIDVCNGNNCALILGNNVLCGVAEDWLVTPQLTPTNQEHILSFTMHQSFIQDHGNIYTLRVSTASATDTSDFQIVKTWNESQMPLNCTVSNFDFSNYIGDSIYVAFVMENDEGDNWIIDDVTGLKMVGNCYPPTGLETFDVISNSAGLRWASIDTVSNYFWEVVPKGNDEGTGVISSGYVLDTLDYATGLQMTTDYDYRLRSLCASGDTSYYSYPFSFTTLGPPPVNDECDGAIELVVNQDNTCSNVFSGTNLNATESMSGCIGIANDDVWYKFVAAGSNQDIQLHNITAVNGNSIDMVFEVFSGYCGNLASILCSDENFNTLNGLNPGDTYYLRIYSKYNTSSQEFDVCIKTPPIAPGNDDCSNAVVISVNPDMACNLITSGTTLGATETMTGCVGNADDDVWFSFIATGIKHNIDILNIIPVEGNNSDMVHEVFEGNCNNLVSVKCSDDNYSSITGLSIGQNYYVRVYSKYNTSRQNFDICVKTPPPPPNNDFCENSILINVGEYGTCPANAITCSTVNATNTMYGSCDSYGSDPDLWYHFTAQVDGDYTFSSISGNAGLTLYKGDCDNLIEVSCLNNTSGTLEDLESGIAYYARVYTDFEEANTQFCIEKDISVSNDNVAGAILLQCGQGFCDMPKIGSNQYATDSQTNPSPYCGNYNGGDLWYKIIVPSSGNIEIEMSRINNFQDGAMAIYSGDIQNLSLLSCDDDSNTNPGTNFMPHISLTNQSPGDTLFVRVWEYGNDVFGNFSICAWEPVDIFPSNIGDGFCESGSSVIVDNLHGNTYTWVPLLDGSNNIIAFLYPYGNELGTTYASVYRNTTGSIRKENNIPYMDRDIQISVDAQPTGENPMVRLIYTQEEINELVSQDSEISSVNDIIFTKTSSNCTGYFNGSGESVNQTANDEINSSGDSYIQCSVNGFSTFYGNRAGIVLPIGLKTFAGFEDEYANILTWSIETQKNISFFNIQKSLDLKEWQNIDIIKPNRDSNNQVDYSSIDKDPSIITYYRIKIVDQDGNFYFSKIILIERKVTNLKLNSIYPNPNNGNFLVNYSAKPENKVKMILINSLGIEVFSKIFKNKKRLTIGKINTRNLQNGVYTLIIKQSESIATKRVIINN